MILFLCTGNINRSAAAAILAGPDVASSAGTSINAAKSRPVAKRMRDELGRLGVDDARIARQRSRYVGHVDLSAYYAIVGFQPSHGRWVREVDPNLPYRSILELVPHPEWTTKVPDPAFDRDAYPAVADYIARAVARIVHGRNA